MSLAEMEAGESRTVIRRESNLKKNVSRNLRLDFDAVSIRVDLNKFCGTKMRRLFLCSFVEVVAVVVVVIVIMIVVVVVVAVVWMLVNHH